MKLTEKEYMDICIELWERMEKTGAEQKYTWVGWKKYGKMLNNCPLCEYVGRNKGGGMKGGCKKCPLGWGFMGCEENIISQYTNWLVSTEIASRKKYAGLFLEQLKEIRSKL